MRALQGMVIKRKRALRRKQSGAGIRLCRSGGLRTQAADSPPVPPPCDQKKWPSSGFPQKANSKLAVIPSQSRFVRRKIAGA
jgi:hypothetical protein